jgi:hypothetical protein
MLVVKPIRLSKHAEIQCLERGTSAAEVIAAIRTGFTEPAKHGLMMCRLNFEFYDEWNGKHYAVKQVAPVFAESEAEIVVVTVYVYYF